MTTVSFPGLGIGEFQMNPVAFTIPIGDGLTISWYGILIVIGMILAFSYCAYRATKHESIKFDDLLDFTIYTVIFAIIGARAYYVLTSWDKYADNFWQVFNIRGGGLAIYGGIIAGAITIIVIARIKKFSFNKAIKLFDAVAPAVMIGQIIGRWGNFVNGEAYGAPTSLPWRMCSDTFAKNLLREDLIDQSTYHSMMSTAMGVHPTFFYESLWNLIGLIIIHFIYKKKKFDGQILLMYVTWYGFGRMLIEGLRMDSLYVGVFRISQVIGFLCFTIGGVLLIINLVKANRKKKDAEAYSLAYKKLSKPSAAFNTEGMEVNEESAESETDEKDEEGENDG